MNRPALLAAVVLLVGCKAPAVLGPPKVDPMNFESRAIRISYFRFDRYKTPRGEKIGPSAWVVYSKSWVRRFGENLDEPFIKAFPRGKVGVGGRRKGDGVGLILGKGRWPDEELQPVIKEIVRRGLLSLPSRPIESITREYTLKMIHDPLWWQTFRIISIATEKGSYTVLLTPMVKDPKARKHPPHAETFFKIEYYVSSVLPRLAPTVVTGVGER
jgi:hypothetical protein